MRSATRAAQCTGAIRRRGARVLMLIAIAVLAGPSCGPLDSCKFEWTVEGDTGISVGNAPRLTVTICSVTHSNEFCGEGVVDTGAVVVDGATVNADFGAWRDRSFRLTRSHPTWLYDARLLVNGHGRSGNTIEVRDQETGALLFRIRYDATRNEDDADSCWEEHTIADMTPHAASD